MLIFVYVGDLERLYKFINLEICEFSMLSLMKQLIYEVVVRARDYSIFFPIQY